MFSYDVDLTAHEAWRRSAVLRALGSDWDPFIVLRHEEQALDMLYSNLDVEQQVIYDQLVSAGVLPKHASVVPD